MKDLKLIKNQAVEKQVVDFLESKVSYSSLSDKDKCIALKKLECACKSCDLHYSGYQNVPSKLNPECKFLFIGRNPCKGEAQCNEMFPSSTPQGAVFHKYLTLMGIGPSEYSAVNMCNCYSKGGRPITQEEVNKCVSFRNLELQCMKDIRIIFPMGQDALKYLYGVNHPGSAQCIGDIYHSMLNDREILVVPLWHPSHICLEKDLWPGTKILLEGMRSVVENVRNME